MKLPCIINSLSETFNKRHILAVKMSFVIKMEIMNVSKNFILNEVEFIT